MRDGSMMRLLSRLMRYGVTVALVGAILFGGTILYIFSFYERNTLTQRHACAVVFGAAVWPGGEPSHALADRVHAAIDLYQQELVSCLVFSGAPSAYDKHEVDVMLDVAYERAVTLEDVELDYDGDNTRATIQNLAKDRSYVLVSNDFHLARIDMLAHKAGLERFSVFSSPYRFGRYGKESQFVAREVAALWYYAVLP